MRGVDPQTVLLRVSSQLDSLRARPDIEQALDELEYVYEVLDPEFQDGATLLITQLRARLEELNAKS